eukprot:1343111-Amphidinium_carterae.1
MHATPCVRVMRVSFSGLSSKTSSLATARAPNLRMRHIVRSTPCFVIKLFACARSPGSASRRSMRVR